MTELTILKTEELFNTWGTYSSNAEKHGKLVDNNEDKLSRELEVTEYYNYNINEQLHAYTVAKKMPNDLSSVKESGLVRSAYQWNNIRI